MSIFIALIIAGIIGSGIMVIKTGREERQTENDWIEQEGEKYIARMNEEKTRRLEEPPQEVS
ncbi:sporulation YhaL family protein [Bacillus massiliigorillae]|uniref:sporulation YhaL family protein n=1 Tax=Bacillus massiliigorillae TaxID=1243664 RepID=UPI0003A1C640|nr:sporulation YhaL family protein [Bacillus massiliigorillae]